MVRYHLYKHGFQPNYLIWTDHGEERPNIHKGGGSNSSGLVHNCQRKRKVQTQIGETSEDSAHEVDEAKQSQTPSTPPVSGWSLEEDRWTSRVEKTTHNTLVVTREAEEMAHYALVVAREALVVDREANEGIQKVQNDFDCFKLEFIEHLEALERRQSDGASCSSGHSCSHPRYDDGDDLDDQSLDVNAVHAQNKGNSEFSIIISGVKNLLSLHSNFEVKFVKRQENSVAYLLAKAANSWSRRNVFQLIPHCIENTFKF
ncbi:unnamed protein product [Trifolium pratense]|uniref:Uncharacterized protein n=1 Tax=Trifolium pratense TaxID=57577 RepID=A0ACB0J0X2_TRIPR|nr:unnamed protein product [Trifolium pratense]